MQRRIASSWPVDAPFAPLEIDLCVADRGPQVNLARILLDNYRKLTGDRFAVELHAASAQASF